MLDAIQVLLLTVVAICFATHRWLRSRCTLPSSHATHVETKTAKDGRTFRVRGVPLDWDADRLRTFLMEQDGSATPIVGSIAPEIHGRSLTGTATFRDAPVALQTLRTGQTSRFLLPGSPEKQSIRPEHLILDVDFLGVTTLFAPPDEDHKVE
jgi:protein SERAC1